MSLFGSMFRIMERMEGEGAMSSRALEMAEEGGIFLLLLALILWIVAFLWSINPPQKDNGTAKSTASPADNITRDTER